MSEQEPMDLALFDPEIELVRAQAAVMVINGVMASLQEQKDNAEEDIKTMQRIIAEGRPDGRN